jgi:hypothetical protein
MSRGNPHYDLDQAIGRDGQQVPSDPLHRLANIALI